MELIYKDEPYVLEISITDDKGEFVSGLIEEYEVYSSLDDSLVETGELEEVGTTGVYKKVVSFSLPGQYRVIYKSPEGYFSGIETVVVRENLVSEVYNISLLIKAGIKNRKYLEKVGATWYLVIRNDDDTADILRKPLKDKLGQEVEDIAEGVLAQELKSEV